MSGVDLSIWLVFGAGILSFISPCCLPLYPSYLSYITGVSVKDLQEGRGMFQHRAMLHTVFFMLGFSIIFIALGWSLSLVGSLFANYQNLIRQLGGILVALMGLVMMGLFKPKMLLKDLRFSLPGKPVGYTGSVLIGMIYAAGWTPCVGPILGAVLAMAVSNPDQALLYTISYTLGFAVPFFVMAFFIGRTKWIVKYSNRIMKIGGAVMVVVGILLYTDKMTDITIFFINLYGGFIGV